ncbi:PadR family transcriptional regulator [Indiicoccus explosivorum]|uniref:PadR family transcriptional regulator n=1 Tax=Indiicoccus explosivorum TaxID=1917864 RepID=UPI000B44CF48|nr:PadR family transcriptional regulator [Indiicoccus explosivorum]
MMGDKWLFQLKKGSFELAVLLLLKSKPMYGYEITKKLQETGELSLGGSAIYPVLKRLHVNDFIDYYWADSENGPQKKYYFITDAGRKALKNRMETYRNFYGALSSLDESGGEET